MIVLPMAGISRRFFELGYEQPKYMLELHGNTVFDHALASFRQLFDQEIFLLICRDVCGTPAFVRDRASALGLNKDRLQVVVLDHETRGQAETVAMGLRSVVAPKDSTLTVFNIDTFRPRFNHPTEFDVDKIDGYLEVFEAPGNNWSFAKPIPGTDRVAEVAEKKRISNLCSDGLYYFRSVDMYLSLFAEVEAKDPASLSGGEYYVAPLYNIAIARGSDIRFSFAPRGALRFCGTPAEYTALLERSPFSPDSVDYPQS